MCLHNHIYKKLNKNKFNLCNIYFIKNWYIILIFHKVEKSRESINTCKPCNLELSQDILLFEILNIREE